MKNLIIKTFNQVLMAFVFIFLLPACSISKQKIVHHPDGLKPVIKLLKKHGILINELELKKKQKLDLFGSNIQDKDLVLLKRISWLKALNLGQSRITYKGISSLKHSFPNLQILNLNGLELNKDSIVALSFFTQLRELNLAHTRGGISYLNKLKNSKIQILDVSHSDFETLDDFKNLNDLRELYLNEASVSSLFWQNFKFFNKLKRLEINNSKITLKSQIWSNHLKSLKYLSVQHAHINKNVFSKTNMPRLEALDLSQSNIHSIQELQNIILLNKLKKLNVSSIYFQNKKLGKVESIDSFENCKLRHFIMMDSPVHSRNLGFLNQCKNLIYLDVSGSKVSGAFLKKASYTKLQFLNLNRSNFDHRYLKYLPRFRNLQTLELEETKLISQNLKFIFALRNLRSLNLNYNDIGNPISTIPIRLKKLGNLKIIGTRFPHASAKQLTKNYPRLRIDY